MENILCSFIADYLRSILVITVSVCVYYLVTRKPKGIPPGPRWTLPLLGDMPFIGDKNDKGNLKLPMKRLRAKYGDIYSLYMGPRLSIVISGYELMREFLVKNGDTFSERPSFYLYDELGKRLGIVSASGRQWKEQRKFVLETLREFGFGRTILEDKIQEELEILVTTIKSHGDKPFDFFSTIQSAVANIIASVTFGKRFEYDNPIFLAYLKKTTASLQAISGASVINVMPFLRFLPFDLFNINLLKKGMNWNIENVYQPAIDEHLKDFEKQEEANDFIGCYIKEIKRQESLGQETSINYDNLRACIADLFTAGTDTTSSSILWTILYWLHYPKVYQKCFKEVDDVIGSGRMPSFKDRVNMPYTEAVIMEVLRIAAIANLGIPHSTDHDAEFMGYNIPKDTIVIANLDSVLSDDTVWGDADNFRPERFIGADGKLLKREEWIPFSFGRRNCPGESMAKMELFIFLTTLIQRFDFQKVDNSPLPTLTGVYGLTHTPSRYEVKCVPR